MARDYNYRHFDPSRYDNGPMGGPQVGDPAPDFDASLLDGESLRFSSFFGGPVVLETGSVTCPQFAEAAPTMQVLAQRHRKVRFVVLYVREAHPGERIGPHRSLDEKLADAWELVEEIDGHRLVLADGLDGAGHRAYGGFPNSVHVIDADGRVAYRAAWNDPRVVGRVLDHMLRGESIPGHLQSDASCQPALGQVPPVLHRGGWRAALDFLRGFPKLARISSGQHLSDHRPKDA